MKSKLNLFLWLVALVCQVQAGAQDSRFFRISGPAASLNIAFRPDGWLVWSNAQPGLTYTIQTESSLSGGAKWVDYIQLAVTQAINTNLLVAFHAPAGMTLIPAGGFTLGNWLKSGNSITNEPDILDASPTNVYVSGIYMDWNLVSYSQWQSVYNYGTNHGYAFAHPGSGKATNHPVQTVDWYDSVKWCNARTEQSGLTPVYYTDAGMTQVYRNGETDTLYANWSANGYRLPTEAEWEKAARGGLSGQRFPWGATISQSLANYMGQTSLYAYDLGPDGYNPIGHSGSTPFTTPVGTFAANGYGLHDLAGNVQEWCWDWYNSNLSSAGSPYAGGNDPRGPGSSNASPNPTRVLRGGNWFIYAAVLRCANRSSSVPSNVDLGTGFRCVRGL